MDNEAVGPLLRQVRVEGQAEILRSLIQKRIGQIPPAVAERIAALPAQLNRVALRLVDARRSEELFGAAGAQSAHSVRPQC